ncbi:hypothetical protein [Streptomyces sp. NPDC093093]|uniref:hypothetical protein n=1 Tax=Streptomyces sp. NPDC093093 TaxID=3366025 RepID=UPI00380F35D2
MTKARQHTRPNSHHRRLLAATAAAAIAATLTAGCTKDSEDGKASSSPTSTSTPATTPSSAASASADPLQADKTEVQAAYDRYWSVLTAAYAKSDSAGTDLKQVASGSAYAQTEQGLTSLRSAGQVITGEAKHSGTEVSFKDGPKLKTALVNDCVDISQWKPVDKKTGAEIPLSKTRLLRYKTTLTAEKWPAGWVFIEEKIQGQSC